MKALSSTATLTTDDTASDGYECCFCGLPIEAVSPDPCRLELRINLPSEPKMSQELFCHANCLRNVIVPGIPTLMDAI